MHFIILLLLVNSSFFLYAMDQRKSIDDKDDYSGDYVLNTMEKYHHILQQILEKQSSDLCLWMESCEQVGRLKTCIELGIINDPSLGNSIGHIFESHEQTTLMFIERMESKHKLTKTFEKE